MSTRFSPVLIACVLCSAASVALAQPAPAAPAQPPAPAPNVFEPALPPSTAVAPVTVEAGPKPTPKVIEKQTHTFVESYAATPNGEIEQIGRWRDAVCVQVLGLAAAQSAAIKARIEEVATEVGLHAPKPGCTADVEIVFSDNPQGVMDKVAKEREYLLGYYHRHDHDRLKKVTRPIQAWYVTATYGGGGDVAGALFGGASNMQVHEEVIDDPENSAPTSCGDNRFFSKCLESVFKNVFIVADSRSLAGKDTGMVADYLAMLALSQPNSLDACAALSSVLDVFAPSGCGGREPPDGFTRSDAAYLTALYAADGEGRKTQEQTDISTRMARILTKASNAGR
jgi:hypothetical protein